MTSLAFRRIITVTPANAVVSATVRAGGTEPAKVPYSRATYSYNHVNDRKT